MIRRVIAGPWLVLMVLEPLSACAGSQSDPMAVTIHNVTAKLGQVSTEYRKATTDNRTSEGDQLLDKVRSVECVLSGRKCEPKNTPGTAAISKAPANQRENMVGGASAGTPPPSPDGRAAHVAVAPASSASWTRPTDPERAILQASVALLVAGDLVRVGESWHVAPERDALPVRCGGGLVGPRRVVTSRECINSLGEFADIRVVLGHGIDAPPEWVAKDDMKMLRLADRDVFTLVAAPRFGGPGDHWALFEIAGNGPEAEPLTVASAPMKHDKTRGVAIAGHPAGRPLQAASLVPAGAVPVPADAALFFIVGRPQDIPGSPVVDVAGRKLVGILLGGIRVDGRIEPSRADGLESRLLAVQRVNAGTSFAKALAVKKPR